MAAKSKIKLDQLQQTITKTLEEYADYVSNGVVKEACDTAANIAVNELKQSSPRRSGKYAESWDFAEVSKRNKYSVTVFSNGQYRLTHLLENGHKTRPAGKRPKKNRKNFVEARPHIAATEAKVADNVVNEIKRMLGK